MKTAQIIHIDQTNPGVSLKQMSQSYNAGAVAILSEVAKVKLEEFEESNRVFVSKETNDQADTVKTLYSKLIDALKQDQELVKLFCNYDTETSYLQGRYGTDTFIQGFIEGYKFLSAVNGDGRI